MSHRSGSENRIRTIVYTTRWSPDEFALLHQLADHDGGSIAQVLRRLVRQAYPMLLPSRLLVTEVRRIGANLNQLTRHAHGTQTLPLAELRQVHADLLVVLRALRS